ncbi:hypothetical protein HDU84_002535 [Entophlyctis sp. JEL0112]|nr:hypothetical protein HDU84_002535 [Entophlyctis sp. JEL0112]
MALQLVPDAGGVDGARSEDKEASDGLVVAARGLGLHRVVLGHLLKAHATPSNLVLLIGASAAETTTLFAEFSLFDSCALLGNETSSQQRRIRYLEGGVIASSPAVFIVDLLNKVIPVDLISGVLVCHAHRITEASAEAFILRLVRESNKVAFIRAFSENPESLTNTGVIWKLEKTMKLLFLRKVFFWPRFHMRIQQCIDSPAENAIPISVQQVRIPMTKNMSDIQAAIIDCIGECIGDLKRMHRFSGEEDQLTVENALFSSFETLLRSHLNPVWHRIPLRARKIVSDISTLRRLLGYLTSYDAVSFYAFLESVRVSNALTPLQMTHVDADVSPWLMYDAADVIFSSARKRVVAKDVSSSEAMLRNSEVFGDYMNDVVPGGLEVIGEELPKWRVLKDLIDDIESHTKVPGRSKGPILVMVHGERTCVQLAEILSGSIVGAESSRPAKKRKEVQNEAIAEADEDTVVKSVPKQSRRRQRGSVVEKVTTERASSTLNACREFVTAGSKKLVARQIARYFRWRQKVTLVQQNIRKTLTNAKTVPNSGSNTSYSRGGGQARRRVRGGSAGLPSRRSNSDIDSISESVSARNSENDPENLEFSADETSAEQESYLFPKDAGGQLDMTEYLESFGLVDTSSAIIIRPYSTSILSSSAGGFLTNGDDDSRILEEVDPAAVIMYDVDMAFIRRLEVWHAQNKALRALHVYFMIYNNSTEEQKYLTSLRKEKEAFEKLIQEKANMAIPIDQDGRVVDPEDIFWRNLDTRVAGGQQLIPAEESNLIIVDVREFRSALPSILHSHRMKLRPCTLEVGDYVLTPHICVERKSIPDLASSFKSGRLFVQVEAMCLHYQTPVLLIEFAQGKTFALCGGSENSKNSGDDLNSKLALLAITFPKLRIIWSSSQAATAEIFSDLKKDQKEPSMDDAMAIGVETGEKIDSIFNITPSDMIRAMPGITSRNYKNIMRRAVSIAAMAGMDLDQLQSLVGEEGGRMLHHFLNSDARQHISKQTRLSAKLLFTSARTMNRLRFEKSPYLIQHKDNPVDWYPWGPEAFKLAKDLDKPILLSVGYSTCHWCHVMAHESFENEDIAKVMNKYFVNVKVDREERPTVDRMYMTYVQSLTGGGGWPMTVFLTPELKPFYGGTYFAPDSKYGRPGFPKILEYFGEKWLKEKSAIVSASEEDFETLASLAKVSHLMLLWIDVSLQREGPKSMIPVTAAMSIARQTYLTLAKTFDSVYGGFGGAVRA